MEEDIKLLESLIEEYERVCKEYQFYNVPVHIDENDIQAIENLIKGYRELEDRYLKNRQRTIKLELKIKEIRDKAEVMDYYTLPDVIDDLNKLLGDE